MGATNLLCHLKFEVIDRDRKIPDASGQGNDGTAVGPPKIVPDARFGSCLALEDPSQYVELAPACIPAQGAFTMSFWTRGLDAKAGWYFFLDTRNAAKSPLLRIELPGGPNGAGSGSTAEWRHWAFVCADRARPIQIYRNGATPPASQPLPQPQPPPTGTAAEARFGATFDGQHCKGQFACLRIYNKALDSAEIAEDMEDDQTALASFRQSYPIDFALRNQDEQRVLYIAEGNAGHPMYLELTNATDANLNLKKPEGVAAPPEKFHFALKFRPGILSPSVIKAGTTMIETALPETLKASDWAVALRDKADGVFLYLLAKQGWKLPPKESLRLTLPEFSADAGGGARSTLLELDFRDITLGDQVETLSGVRTSHLSVLHSSGQRRVPLHVGFVGAGDILNDGETRNPLELRITNTDPVADLTFEPGLGDGAKFKITWDVDDDWALAKHDEFASVEPESPWTKTLHSEGDAPLWTLTPASKVTLAPREAITVKMEIVSSLPAGQANLYVRYENVRISNVSGDWDGGTVVPVTKSPIMLAKDNTVGIGTAPENAKLHIDGSLRIDNGAITLGQNSFISGNLRVDKGAIQLDGNSFSASITTVHPTGQVSIIDKGLTIKADGDGALAVGNDNLLKWKKGNVIISADLHTTAHHFAAEASIDRLKIGKSAFQAGIDFKAETDKANFKENYKWGWYNPVPTALKIVADVAGVLAVADDDVLEWHKGGVMIKGDLYAYNKFFRIAHPTIPGNDLIHACLEGPESAVYYRGRGRLREGRATVRLPEYFEALTRPEGRTVTLTAIGREPFLLSYEDVAQGAFRVHGTKPDGEFSWEIKAVRADVDRLEAEVPH
jgi:hypothetical protein